MDISSDATFLAVLSASEVGQEGSQELSLWELANTDEHPALATFVPSAQQHTCVRFNTSDVREIMTNGQYTTQGRVAFFLCTLEREGFSKKTYAGRKKKEKKGKKTLPQVASIVLELGCGLCVLRAQDLAA